MRTGEVPWRIGHRAKGASPDCVGTGSACRPRACGGGPAPRTPTAMPGAMESQAEHKGFEERRAMKDLEGAGPVRSVWAVWTPCL